MTPLSLHFFLHDLSQSNPEQFRSRRIIEALRLGLMPDDCVGDFTYGRDREIDNIRKWLDSPDQGTNIVIGEYGSGKTHLLNYLRQYLIQDRFATAYVEVDPNASPFSKPKRIYNQIVKSLQIQDSSEIHDFRWLIEKSAEKSYLRDHHYFKWINTFRSIDPDDSKIWAWIEASDSVCKPWKPHPKRADENLYSKLPGLYDTGTSANIYCYLISTLGWLVTQSPFNKKGLVLLFDEAESLYAHSTKNAKERSFNFLDALIDISDNKPRLLKPPGYSGLQYCRYASAQNIPFLYNKNSNIKILLAFTDSQFTSAKLDKINPLYLTSIDQKILGKVLIRVIEIYQDAYQYQLKAEDYPNISSRLRDADVQQHLRLFIKGCVELLDVRRFKND